ncbi:ABC transporter ATP-binding protein [Leifsonia sp. ZF2019]|uniref:ABC transporter ATP-binding protein n=1 Tax=Leifsonia sp. ZF2019 TaxID=2781978 RepID=UPI001CBA9AB2|nr:ABC transporter ATP-binding protein [Leifsonia sp. ZF2019]UAJ78275.1 ABC transporter ATP-binding protein [Leifsonia sp. ZF2019]
MSVLPTAPAADASVLGLTGHGSTVELRGLVRDFGGGVGLNRLDLAAEPGELIALLGPSGCGKTTALRALAGLERVDAGSILVDGRDVTDEPANRRDLGMVFQSYSLFPHLTAGQNVEFGLRMRKVPGAERRGRAAEALELVGLGAHGGRYAHQLSGGQQQRVALARALVTRPRVLLLDEPLSALDAQVRVQLREEIRRIQTELGITTFFVTHDQEEALAVADRVAVMRAGVIEQIGRPEELYLRPASAFVAEFVGLTNRIPATVAGGRLTVLGQEVPLATAVADGPVTAYIRPEDVLLASAGHPGEVLTSSFLGALRRTRVRLADGTELAVQHAAGELLAAGDRVTIALSGAPATVSPVAAPPAA